MKTDIMEILTTVVEWVGIWGLTESESWNKSDQKIYDKICKLLDEKESQNDF